MSKIDIKTKKIALLGIGIALYVVLGFMVKIPLISHIQTDLGYIAFGCLLYLVGWQACVVGIAGCLFESLIFSGWIPIGWMVGQLIIGIICGLVYTKTRNTVLHVIATVIAVFIGIALVKTMIECTLYGIPLMIKLPKNLIAFIADTIPMLIGYFIAKRLPEKYKGVEKCQEEF